jgi:outer membrane PBP1 activator LpoA protein
MLGLIKAAPLILVVAGGAYAYHTTTVSKAEAKIARLESNAVVLKENAAKLDAAFESEKAARERSEQNLQIQLEAVSALTEKNTEMQAEMDDYLSIFKRHNLTKLARVKPGLIEPRINKGTKDVFEAIEKDSEEVENADSN